MSGQIMVIGSSNVDFIMKTDHLPARDETVTDADFMQTFGGKGANQAVAAGRAGGKVFFVNCVGDDPYAAPMVQGYRDSGVNTDYLLHETGVSCGTALIMIGEGGHNYLTIAPGANYRLTPDRISFLRPQIAASAFILIQYEILPETIERVLTIAEAENIPVIWNFAPAREIDLNLLRKTAIMVVNEPEAGMLTGIQVTDQESAKAAARKILELGAQKAIVTLGEDGSMVAESGEKITHVPAFKVKAVDTTAAGDTYCGCLTVALAEGKQLPEAVTFAAAAAALSVQKMGAQPSTPWRGEIDAFLEQNKK